MAQTGTREYNGNISEQRALGASVPLGAGSNNTDLGALSLAAGNGNKAARVTPGSAVVASGLVVKRQWDDTNVTIIAWPAGVPLPFQVSVVVSTTVDLLVSW